MKLDLIKCMAHSKTISGKLGRLQIPEIFFLQKPHSGNVTDQLKKSLTLQADRDLRITNFSEIASEL